ncbi:MAG: NAD(P)-dependent alcohol dehydrogenase [Oscillospiraceae bacterium]
MKIRAAVLHGAGKPLEIESLDLTEPGEGELLVKIAACGICHTDEMQRRYPDYTPIVLGHEASGVVTEVGPGVTEFSVGDHVALSYGSCGKCAACLENRPFECENHGSYFDGWRRDGSTPLSLKGEPVAAFFCQGGFAEYAVVETRSATKVDGDIDLALVSPLGCGIQTGAGTIFNCFRPRPGQSIAIIGMGTVGLSAVMAAKLAGCKPIIAVDRFDDRLYAAGELGATHCINGGKCADLLAAIRSVSSGLDFALDTSANSMLRALALKALGRNGMGASLGYGSLPRLDAEDRALGKSWNGGIVEGSSVPQTFIPYLLGLYKQGEFPIDRLITVFPFEKINEAFEANCRGAVIKSVAVMP